jgi:hypothetical protein
VRAIEALRESTVPDDPLDVPHFLDEIATQRAKILNPPPWYRRDVLGARQGCRRLPK